LKISIDAESGSITDPLLSAADAIRIGKRFVLVTVIDAKGSTPRKVGARMIVETDGKITGSVGGGAVEKLAIEKALEVLAGGEPERLKLDLDDVEGHQTGAICGGTMELLIEPFGIGQKLHLFGAGHVAQPTAKLAMDVGFRVVVNDSRAEWANADRYPGASVKVGDLEDIAGQLETTDSDFIVIMTHSHETDFTVLRQLLRKPYYYLGVIGSTRKAVEIRNRLLKEGFSEEEISRLTCPIGIDIGSHTPAEIAVSVIAQLIALRKERDGK